MSADRHGGMVDPSPWVRRFAGRVPDGGPVLDVACGGGRHTRLFLGLGHPVAALDRDLSRLGDLADTAGLETIEADLEEGSPWPLGERRFAGVVVTNYLYRPLLRMLADALAPGGVLIYETFAAGNERFGKPSNPDYLLRPGELLEVYSPGLHIVAFEQGLIETPREAAIQRIVSVNRTPGSADPVCCL